MNSCFIVEHSGKASYMYLQGTVVRKRLSTVQELDLDLEHDLELAQLTVCGEKERFDTLDGSNLPVILVQLLWYLCRTLSEMPALTSTSSTMSS